MLFANAAVTPAALLLQGPPYGEESNRFPWEIFVALGVVLICAIGAAVVCGAIAGPRAWCAALKECCPCCGRRKKVEEEDQIARGGQRPTTSRCRLLLAL